MMTMQLVFPCVHRSLLGFTTDVLNLKSLPLALLLTSAAFWLESMVLTNRSDL